MPVWLSAGEARCFVAIGSPRAAGKPGALSSNLELQIHIWMGAAILFFLFHGQLSKKSSVLEGFCSSLQAKE